MTYSASLGLTKNILKGQDTYDEIQIDYQDIKKELECYETNTNKVSHTAKRKQIIQSNVTDPKLLVAVIKLEKKSFNNENFVCRICFNFLHHYLY
jgi:hypothetical protein